MIEVVILIIILLLILCFCFIRVYRIKGGYHHTIKLDPESVKIINNMFKFIIDNDKTVSLSLCPSFATLTALKETGESTFYDILVSHLKVDNDLKWVETALRRRNNESEKRIRGFHTAIKALRELKEMKAEIKVDEVIDLSDFTKEEYDTLEEPFDGDAGYQILNNAINNIRLELMSREEIDNYKTLCNKYAKMNDASAKISHVLNYSANVIRPGRHINFKTHGYKAVKTFELLTDVYKKRKIPLRFLFCGYELTTSSAGQSGGIGMYCSPNPNVCMDYIGPNRCGIIYRYAIDFDRFFYSSINTRLPEGILRFITHNFDKEYVSHMTREAKELFCILHSDVMSSLFYMSYEYYNKPDNKKALHEHIEKLIEEE